MNTVLCPLRFCRGVLVPSVVNGRAVLSCPQCDRRRAGICRDCPRRVEGTVGKAIRCAACKAARRRENGRRWMSIDENRDRKNARYRKRYRARTAERQAKDAARKRQWRRANRAKVKAEKRRFLLRDGKARRNYLRYQARYNRRRAAAKREYMRARYYAEHPERPNPHCAGCREPIPWKPLPKGRAGAPPKWCDRCCTPAEFRRRLQRRAAVHAPPSPGGEGRAA